MRVYFTVRQIPECMHLDATQVLAVQREVLMQQFRRSSWVLTFGSIALGGIGAELGRYLSLGSDGWRFFGVVVGAWLAATVYVPSVVASARPQIREYLRLHGWDRSQ